MPAAATITPPTIRMMIGAIPIPPPEESSVEDAGVTAVGFALPDFAFSEPCFCGVAPVGAEAEAEVVLVEVVAAGALPEPLAAADLSPVAEGTLGRYSCPDGAAAADAASTAAVAAARQTPATVLPVVIKAGGRRY
jgi:hypothetical protein